VEFTAQLASFAIVTAGTLLWAKWSKLDLGLRSPALKGVWPWVGLFVLWCAAESALDAIHPIEVDPEWLEEMQQLSLPETLVLTAVLDPLCEELLFRGVMFSALIRRWGIRAAAVVPSLLWGLVHVQYEWWYVASIAGSGVVLAIIRWKSGSIYVPLGLHAAFNLLIALSSYFPLAPAA